MTDSHSTMNDDSPERSADASDQLDVLSAVTAALTDVTERIGSVSVREDIDHPVCDRLVGADAIRFVWSGVVDEAGRRVHPLAWAGTDPDALDLDTSSSSPSSTPVESAAAVQEALQTETVVLVESLSETPVSADEAFESGHSVAVVPLADDGRTYGVIVVEADDAVFTSDVTEALRNLGRAVAHGIRSADCSASESNAGQPSTALQRQREAFERIVADIEEYALFRLDASGHVESWNRGAEAIKGYSADEILGSHVRTFYTEADRDRGLPEQLLDEARENGRAEDEGWRVRADGTRFWASVVVNALTDEDGTVRGFAKVTRDMTNRKRRERHLDAVFNSTFQFMGLLDTEGTVLRVNDAALELVEESREEIIGRPAWETPWWQGNDERVASLKDAIERASSGEFVKYEVDIDTTQCDDDRPVTIDFSLTPVYDDDGDVSLVVPEGHDITVRKERARELRREQERLEFVNRVIRHNLLNGLNVVGARADILDDFVDDAGRTHLDTVQNRVDEMTDLVGTMRTFMNVIVEDEQHEFEARSISETVEDCVTAARDDYPDATISVGSIPEISVWADELLDEVVDQLLANAIQHNDTPHPTVTLDVAAGDKTVELRVSDDGPGIPDEEKHKIVDKRIEDLSNPSSGFGLFLVREIVEGYGGDVRIEDNDPEGSTFVVELPRP
nr:PAS domain S-box protein [Haloferax larsenii]